MELSTVESLARLLESYSLSKIDVADGSEHYVLERAQTKSAPVYTAVPATAEIAVPAPVKEETVSPVRDEANVQKASLVGTVYLSPAEGKPPFVAVGDRVKKGDTVCIIEAMKILNEIPAERDGVITEVLVKNEETVEFGQGLFVIG